MSKSKIDTLELVTLAHSRYTEYEAAFVKEPYTEKGIQEQLKKATEDFDFDSPEFEEIVINTMIEKPARRADVTNAATKFTYYAAFYIATEDKELPADIKKDYDALVLNNKVIYYHSIINGKFVKNEEKDVTLDKEKLRALYKSVKETM